MAEDLERRHERQRLGLEPLPPEDGGGTLAGLLEWWLANHSAGSPSHARNTYSVRRHLLSPELGRAFNAARRTGYFTGLNPILGVRKRRVPRRKPDYLKAAEVPRVLEDPGSPLATAVRGGRLYRSAKR